MSTLLDFYLGTGVDSRGRTFGEILAFSDEDLERVHDWVQWLFPLPEPSYWNPDAPLLTPEDLTAFRKPDVGSSEKTYAEWTCLHTSVGRAWGRYSQFLRDTKKWMRPGDHNHLRITRALRFLTLTGNGRKARLLHNYCLSPAVEFSGETRWYWEEALKENPAYLRRDP